jgi:hypothetical protein
VQVADDSAIVPMYVDRAYYLAPDVIPTSDVRPLHARKDGLLATLILLDGMLTSPDTRCAGDRCRESPLPDVVLAFDPWRSLTSRDCRRRSIAGHSPLPRSPAVGIDKAGRAVLPYLVASVVNDDVRAFLQRHGDLLRAVPDWTVRPLFFKRVGALGGRFERRSGRSWQARCHPP